MDVLHDASALNLSTVCIAPAASARADPTQFEIVGGEEPIIDTIEVSGDQYEVAKHYVDPLQGTLSYR